MTSPLPPTAELPPGLEIRPSPIAGVGLFTEGPARAGDRLAVIEGEVIDGDEAERRDAAGNVYIYELTPEAYVDAAAGLGRHVNHACEPSCRVETRDERSLWLVAQRDLPAGSELTIDYDYPEIFEACRRFNPSCARDACPRAAGDPGGSGRNPPGD